jgi:8-oxo-dGTP pyrophosphatase MutT (NUDIX family)
LLGLRLNNPGRGKWSFPGGGAEGKEELITTGVREFKEETGIQLYGRYITRVGVYKIKNLFFEWETQIIETTQRIDPRGIGLRFRTGEAAKNYSGEFFMLDWVDINELDQLRLHCWVKEVIAIYNSDAMKVYTPKPPVKKKKAGSVVQSKLKTGMSGADCLFDIAEMILTKTCPDGTKYFMPRYAPVKTKVENIWK